MRVIAGQARGRRLEAVKGKLVRPMTDQIREALFATLGPRVPGARFLDLYAGSGSVGIEALSRGASSVTFVERDPGAVAVIRRNLEATDLAGRAVVVRSGVEQYLKEPPAERFDIAVIDPPFGAGPFTSVLHALAEGFLAPGGVAVLRVASRAQGTELPLEIVAGWTRRYGDSTLIYMGVQEIRT